MSEADGILHSWLGETPSGMDRTFYSDGDDVTYADELECPESCRVPRGLRLVQVVTPGTAFSTRCPNGCGIALRMVP